MDNQDERRAEELYNHVAYFVTEFVQATYVMGTDKDAGIVANAADAAQRASDHLWGDLAEICRKAAQWEKFHETAVDGKSDNTSEFVQSVMNAIDSL